MTKALHARLQTLHDRALAVIVVCATMAYLSSVVARPALGWLAFVGLTVTQLRLAGIAWLKANAASALAHDHTAARVLPYVVAGNRGFRSHEIIAIVACGVLGAILIGRAVVLSNRVVIGATVLWAVLAGGVLALLLARPRSGEPAATINPEGICLPHLGLTAPWSAFSGVEVDGESVRWQLRDPGDFRRLTRLRGVRRVYWRLVVASRGGTLVLPLHRMQNPAEAMHRVPWGLAAPPADPDSALRATLAGR